MKLSLYARLAAQNIRKSRRLYVPYLLSGVCMVMIFYVLSALTGDPALLSMSGGAQMAMLLSLGVIVMALFSALFLFYTSSFLMKQRGRELSLYNMLGMSKRHIVCIVFFETLFCAGICIGAGLALGVLSSKAFQLSLLRLMGSPVSPDFTVAPSLLGTTALTFLAIFLLIFLRGAVSVLRCNPVELMRASRSGEKPPRANALKALLGIAMLAAGYVLALRVRNALSAVTVFFFAVLLVIGGTFECFSSASVFFLRLLQSNKGYYYKPNHFISVSSMRYRMKRNGTSLAVICILSTMVLVILSSVTCLYAGTQDMLMTQYPRQIEITHKSDELPAADALSAPVEQALSDEGLTPENVISYRSFYIAGQLDGDNVLAERGGSITDIDSVISITVMPLADYNALCGTSYTLAPGEALATGSLLHRLNGRVTVFGSQTYTFAATGIPLPTDAQGDFDVVEALLLILPDEDAFMELYTVQQEAYGSTSSRISTTYAFDTALPDEETSALGSRLAKAMQDEGIDIYRKVREDNRADYEGTTAGFLFLGIMLSAAFLCAAVLSMYYKQITEGYEDQARFDVMRKVGLSLRMIRQSINSQILTVFFLPLIVAGVHLAFAFPMLTKLLTVFGLFNTRLFVTTVLVSYGAFSLLYVLVYLITSRTYYRIVSGAGQAA
ncbi:MAG: FtsX-like permease family protein [Candidatus Ventricola sp.]